MSSWIKIPNKKRILKSNTTVNVFKPLRLIIGIPTYPRDNISTYGLLQNTINSLFDRNYNIMNVDIKFILVGDDYYNIEELRNIFNGFNVDIYNININSALRNENIPKEVKWMHAVTRSFIFLLEKSLELDYDYLLISADDELYMNSALKNNIEYIRNYNYPDFIFSLGLHPSNKILPINVNYYDLLSNYPEPGNCTESGTLYNIKNTKFIKDMIIFRKERWEHVRKFIESGDINYIEYRINPEDAELWEHLNIKFKNKEYSSLLIPKLLIHHITERTIFNYIK